MFCPLCDSEALEVFFERTDKTFGPRQYFQCTSCRLIFLNANLRLSPGAEKARYDLHQNDANDSEYRRFLGQLIEPLLERVRPSQQGLDYGCGAAEPVRTILKEKGFAVASFDPFYFPDERVLAQQYDFVTCTETAEHFARPALEFKRLRGLLKENGVLAVLTRVWSGAGDFAAWWYHRDPTHVAFYAPETFQRIGEMFDFQVERDGENVFFLSRPPGA